MRQKTKDAVINAHFKLHDLHAYIIQVPRVFIVEDGLTIHATNSGFGYSHTIIRYGPSVGDLLLVEHKFKTVGLTCEGIRPSIVAFVSFYEKGKQTPYLKHIPHGSRTQARNAIRFALDSLGSFRADDQIILLVQEKINNGKSVKDR